MPFGLASLVVGVIQVSFDTGKCHGSGMPGRPPTLAKWFPRRGTARCPSLGSVCSAPAAGSAPATPRVSNG